MNNFNASDYVTMYHILKKLYENKNDSVKLSDDLSIDINKYSVSVVRPRQKGINRTVLKMIVPSSMVLDADYTECSISDNVMIVLPDKDKVKYYNEVLNLQITSLDTIDEIEFQMSTVYKFASLYTFMSYLYSTNNEFFIFSSLVSDYDVLHNALSLLKDYNETRRDKY